MNKLSSEIIKVLESNNISDKEYSNVLREVADNIDRAILCSEIDKCKDCSFLGNKVFSVGASRTPIMIIKDFKTNKEEDDSMLDSMLAEASIEKSSVYITHVFKCELKDNVEIDTEHIEACARNFLKQEISMVNPRYIICMGDISSFLYTVEELSAIRGASITVDGRTICFTYGPSALNNKSKKNKTILFNEIVDDLAKVQTELVESGDNSCLLKIKDKEYIDIFDK